MLDGTQVLWTENDQISIFSNSNSNGEIYSIKAEDAGKDKASFTGVDVGAAPWYALYPADAAASISDGKLLFMISGVQTYKEGSFGTGANLMVAVSSTGNLNFKNLCGILGIQLTGTGVISSITLTTLAEEVLWGSASVDLGYTDAPSLVLTQSVEEPHKTITLDCGAGVELGDTPKTFFFILPPGALGSGFRMEVFDNEGHSFVRESNKDITAERSKLKRMEALNCTFSDTSFLSCEEYGVYDLTKNIPEGIRVYDESADQLALRSVTSSTFRIQSLVNANAISIVFPKNLAEGGTCQLSISSAGTTGVSDATVNAVVLKLADGKCWLTDEASTVGYIIATEL